MGLEFKRPSLIVNSSHHLYEKKLEDPPEEGVGENTAAQCLSETNIHDLDQVNKRPGYVVVEDVQTCTHVADIQLGGHT